MSIELMANKGLVIELLIGVQRFLRIYDWREYKSIQPHNDKYTVKKMHPSWSFLSEKLETQNVKLDMNIVSSESASQKADDVFASFDERRSFAPNLKCGAKMNRSALFRQVSLVTFSRA